MKKIYLSILSLSLVSVATAQTATPAEAVGKIQSPVIKSSKKPTQVASDKAILWGPNTFGTPSEWSFTDNSTPSATWSIGTAGPTGSFSSTYGTLTSTTAADGFALFDSDLQGDGTSAQNSDVYFNTPINLVGQLTVAVEFESLYSHYAGACYVIASTDGINWTEFPVLTGQAVNTASANPEIVSANVSSVVGGSPTAYIGFRFIGGWDYAWMVDDVSIVTLPDNDVALTSGWHGDIVNDYEYSMTPLTQVREMIAGVIVENQGGLPQTVDVTCDVSDGSSIVSTSMQTVVTVPGVSDTIWFNTGFTPAANGTYTPTFSIPADMVTTNDMFVASSLQVNNNLMAHDYGTTGTFGFNPAAADPTNANSSHSWGNVYYPEVDQMIYGLDINFATGTTADLYVLARVQEMDASGSIQDPLTYNNETDHTVISSEIGSSITTITFPTPSLLEAGKGYMIDVLKVDGTTGSEAMYFGGTDASQEDDDFSTFAYGPFGAANAINYYSGWNLAPYIRANFDASLDVNVNTLEGVKVFPNPSQGKITITNNNGDANAIEITNLAGQAVYTTSVSAATTVDLGSFGSGIYLVKVSNGIGSLVERVVIK
ncbi:MAG: hypothetical protein ACJASQ_000765 [Crocinitomicaceae bacterium]|jgi:hypothetical protein